MIKTYLSKPELVYAIQYDGKNHKELEEFCEKELPAHAEEIGIPVSAGIAYAQPGEMIVKTKDGLFHVMQEDYFKSLFDEKKASFGSTV